MSVEKEESKKLRQELRILVTAVSAFVAELDGIFVQKQDKERGKRIAEALAKLEAMRDRALQYGLGEKPMKKAEENKILDAFRSTEKPEDN